MAITLLGAAIAAALAGAAGTAINQVNLSKVQRDITRRGDAEDERLAREGRERIRKTVSEVTPEVQNERQGVRDEQNLASILRTFKQAEDQRPAGGTGTKGKISEATIANRATSKASDKARQLDRAGKLARFFSVGQNTPDNLLQARFGQQAGNRNALSRRGNTRATQTEINSRRPNDAVGILSSVLTALGAVGGLAAGGASAGATAAQTGAQAGGSAAQFGTAASSPFFSLGAGLPATVAPATTSSLGFAPALMALSSLTNSPRRGFSSAGGIV